MNVRRLLPAFVALVAAVPALSGQQIQINRENKTIAISASDEASALADVAVVTVGFRTFGKDQDATYAEATRVSNAIINTLKKSGLSAEAVQSTEQSLSPIDPGNQELKDRYTAGIRFQFVQTWRVTIPAAQAANALHIAVLNGANQSGNIEWQLKDDNALQAEAAGKALNHAREIASGMAKGLSAKLGPLVYASNQMPPRGIFGNMGFGNVELNTMNASIGVARKELAPLAISPERITRSATVYAVFAIE
jgi:uncharacterized protein YggE